MAVNCFLKKINAVLHILEKLSKQVKIKNNLYKIKLLNNHEVHKIAYNCNNKNCTKLQHRRLGPKNYGSIKEIMYKQLATGINITNYKQEMLCETFIRTINTDALYSTSAENRGTKVLQLMHTDVCGPNQTPTIGCKTYLLTFIDDYSIFTLIYMLSKKCDVELNLQSS